MVHASAPRHAQQPGTRAASSTRLATGILGGMQSDDQEDRAPVDDDESVDEETGHAIFFRLLTSADVGGLLSYDELIDAMEAALRQFSSGGVEQPVRTVVPIGEQKVFGVMPAYVRV